MEKKRWFKVRRDKGLPTTPNAEEILQSPCCFVLSTGRCGTALLTKVLEFSDDLLVDHSPSPELEFSSAFGHAAKVDETGLALAFLSARFDNYLEESFCRNRIFVETNNRISFYAKGVVEVCPNAKFIHLVRNPYDFVRSGMRRGYYLEGRIQHQRLFGDQLLESWHTLSRVEKIAWEWNEINQSIELFKSGVSSDQVFFVRSEELFRDSRIFEKIYSFIGVSNPFTRHRTRGSLEKLISRPVNCQKSGFYPEVADWMQKDVDAVKSFAPLGRKYGYWRD